MIDEVHDINHALIEESRPPIYTAMKYWGKKPHNIWREYIETYTKPGMVVFDPFSGSSVAAFEAVKIGRKAIAFDLNPLTSFIIEVYSTSFNREKFTKYLNSIVDRIREDKVYRCFFYTDNYLKEIQHFKWNLGKIYEYGVIDSDGNRKIIRDVDEINLVSKLCNNIEIEFWHPDFSFDQQMLVTDSFINKIGGNNFSNIWTRRNLYILSKIFDEIIKVDDESVKRQLMFGFIQILHLSSKMCVPRNDKSNRSFSTSWGRSAYMCSDRQMEMNPLLLFINNCLGKQSVESALQNVEKYIGKIPKIKKVQKNTKIDFLKEDIDIYYGIVDVKETTKYIDVNSVDFIITDPPYGGLVQYLDLSQIWLTWLKKYDASLTTDITKEITVKKGIKELDQYEIEFVRAITEIKRVLRDKSKVVFTFHNKDISIWNSFLNSLDKAGLVIEKLLHQENKRSGESSVSNPYGTSSSDFYIRCIKRRDDVQSEKVLNGDLDSYILDTIVKSIIERGEPTPYQVIFDKTIVASSKLGLELKYFEERVKYILNSYMGKIFGLVKDPITDEMNWYVLDSTSYNIDEENLASRLEQSILDFLKQERIVTFDQVLGHVFLKFPNGLTPSMKKIEFYLEKHARRIQGKWEYKKE